METLVIGYGNPLRRDDGVGWRAAEQLQERLGPRARVIACDQLLPELALAISEAERVVFIDASVEGEPGQIAARPVAAGGDPARSLTHHVAAPSLMALSETLYGGRARATLYSVAGESFEHGEGLSPIVEAALPSLIEQIIELINTEGGHEIPCTSTR